MKRVVILTLITLMVILAIAGCDDESKPRFTRMSVTPACGVAPLMVEGYATASGGDETGSPTGGNNNLEINWTFEEGATSTTSIAYHTFEEAGTYKVVVTGTDASDNVTSTYQMVTVLPDSLEIRASIEDHPELNVTTADTLKLDVWASACMVQSDVPEDYRKLDFQWDIMAENDTTSFSGQNPLWQFTEPGTYDISLRVTLHALAVTRWDALVVTVTEP